MDDNEFLKEVFRTLTSNPTQQNLDFLIEAYAKVGYLASTAEAVAADAERVRKHEEANEWLRAKQAVGAGGKPVSDGVADKMALVAVWTLRQTEDQAKAKARKINNLLDAIREAIHAIKFLGRYDSSTVNFPVGTGS